MRKTSWLTIGVATAIVGLLTVLMGLLYNWQVAASEAEREQLQRRADADAKAFAAEFNREIQGAYFNFQADPDEIAKGEAAEMSQRYEYWKANTAYPELVKQIIYIPNEGDPKRYDPATASFVPYPAAELGQLRERLSGERGPYLEDSDVLVVPMHPIGKKIERVMIRSSKDADTETSVQLPATIGWVAVFLERSVIRERMLPELAAKHFPTGDLSVSVSNRSGDAIFATGKTTGPTDATAALFDLRPDHFIFFSKLENMPTRGAVKGGETDVVINQRVEKRSAEIRGNAGESDKGKTFTIQMTDDGATRQTTVLSGQTATPWTLGVRHTAGSIAAFVSGERIKYFTFGIGIYLLLVGSILAIVFSSVSARRSAQRQIDFVSSVSHEFRTPLAVIYSAAENLADGVASDGEKVSRYGTLIKNEGKKLSAMVEQILEFAGARSGRKKYNLAPGDVSEAVRRALKDSESVFEESGFEVESAIAADLPKTSIDSDAIETAVRNLIQNAIKYSNGSRWIRVGTQNGDGRIKIVVEDRGIGISDAEKRKIFEPFYRGRDVVDAQIHGNGLGLSLVKEIAEAHGGKVFVESERGKGSRFVIELPC